jgi:hypothetical protein
MSNTNSITDLFSSFNISQNLNTTTIITSFYNNEIQAPVFIPYPQMVMTSPTPIPMNNYGHTITTNPSPVPSPSPNPTTLQTLFYHGFSPNPSPYPSPNPSQNPTTYTSFYHGHSYIPITTTPIPTPNYDVVGMPTPIPTPASYIIHPSVGGSGTHPAGWTPAWGATGTHPPATHEPGSSFGHSGHWTNNKKQMLFTNKFAFEEKDFSIKIHYLDSENNGILNRLYELKCNELNIKTILKINEDTFESMNNKKFDKIVEILEKLSKMNLYYSNICKSILVKDIFINKKLSSKFIIEI